MTKSEIPQELVDTLRQARNIAVLTGAGVSAESPVPTFRDALTGLGVTHHHAYVNRVALCVMMRQRFNPEDLATREAFQRNPKMVWEWYAYRRELVTRVEPNPGHYALAELERRIPQFTLITQNIDGLHHRAGSRNVIELHGNIRRTKCFEEDMPVRDWRDDGQIPPRCPRCGSYLRPDVVWFGEILRPLALDEAFRAARDVFFSIGTSGVVEPAASLPLVALRNGAVVIEVNPDETPLSASAGFHVRAASGIALPELLDLSFNR
jgi:NAD-dependent protein deacetylase/lipoamidase